MTTGGSSEAPDIDELKSLLEAASSAIPDEPFPVGDASARKLNRVKSVAEQLRLKLPALIEWLDPVRHHQLLDPTDPNVAADFLSRRIEAQPRIKLSDVSRFWGAGVYALYYCGDHPAYERISGTDIPIYVGMAASSDPLAKTSSAQGDKLYSRVVGDHRRSIQQAESWSTSEQNVDGLPELHVRDFEVRYLVLQNVYAGAVEQHLIHHYAPVWNNETDICYGIGKHGDAASTRANTRSPWDTLHPGRPWALTDDNVPNPKSWKQIQADVIAYTRQRYGKKGT